VSPWVSPLPDLSPIALHTGRCRRAIPAPAAQSFVAATTRRCDRHANGVASTALTTPAHSRPSGDRRLGVNAPEQAPSVSAAAADRRSAQPSCAPMMARSRSLTSALGSVVKCSRFRLNLEFARKRRKGNRDPGVRSCSLTGRNSSWFTADREQQDLQELAPPSSPELDAQRICVSMWHAMRRGLRIETSLEANPDTQPVPGLLRTNTQAVSRSRPWAGIV